MSSCFSVKEMTLGSSTTACFVLVCGFLSIPLKVSIVRMICNWSWDKVLYQCINVTAESQPTPKKKAALLLKLTGSQMRWLSACIFQYHSSSSSTWLKVHFPHNWDTFMSYIKKKTGRLNRNLEPLSPIFRFLHSIVIICNLALPISVQCLLICCITYVH